MSKYKLLLGSAFVKDVSWAGTSEIYTLNAMVTMGFKIDSF